MNLSPVALSPTSNMTVPNGNRTHGDVKHLPHATSPSPEETPLNNRNVGHTESETQLPEETYFDPFTGNRKYNSSLLKQSHSGMGDPTIEELCSLPYTPERSHSKQEEHQLENANKRSKTFQLNWPHKHLPNLKVEKMAAAGFYYLGSGDTVCCFSCQKALHNWKAGDNPWEEHARYSSGCNYLLQQKGQNDINALIKLSASKHCSEQTVSTTKEQTATKQNICSTPQYASAEARLRTFKCWSNDSPISKEVLSEAGFYYVGFEDQVLCFHCSVGLENWKAGDDPWEEHARCSPGCNYLLQQKGQNYIDNVQANIPAHNKCSQQTMGRLTLLEKRWLCYSCNDQRRETVPNNANHTGLPCGHLIFCEDHAKKEKKNFAQNPQYQIKCPACPNPLTGVLKTSMG